MRFEDLRAGISVKGIVPGGSVKIVNVELLGFEAVKTVYENHHGDIGRCIIHRGDEAGLNVVGTRPLWSFDGDGHLLRLTLEAQRIRLAHLFDPYLALHTSQVEPLPHQITAVYGEMIPRHPLRYLLADDPGTGKTIMAGLLIKELMARGDLERCLVVAPGSLVEQWQDEFSEKFGLKFDILTRDMGKSTRDGNPFSRHNLLIARMDMLSRNLDLQAKLTQAREYDLVICDEAHRMSATVNGSEVKYTKRYRLGQTVASHCRHFLLISATPYNGKEEDFQLFMALIDSDRFAGQFHNSAYMSDVSDLSRRFTKKILLKFDSTPLFPERHAHTALYELSTPEVALYRLVINYVRDEMNRAESFASSDEARWLNISFALQVIQRRLASSPAAICKSLHRRLGRLKKRLSEEKLLASHKKSPIKQLQSEQRLSSEDFDDLHDAPEHEIETIEKDLLAHTTAASTIGDLETEIETLDNLVKEADALRNSGIDSKWQELSSILDSAHMTDAEGRRRKLIVCTESKDTLNYLADKIRTRLGKPEAVVVIHGGIGRKERRRAVEAFTHDKNVIILVANDTASDGINLQRAHLMVNYDLPWNPGKIEQRFGSIHRIGQKEVCHLWNLVAPETREGGVYLHLLKKLAAASKSLGDQVYDLLGQLFEGNTLHKLLTDAIRYGDNASKRSALFREIDNIVNTRHMHHLLDSRTLTRTTLSATSVAEIRENMERAQAHSLQPHCIQSFFMEAFQNLGGQIHPREPGRWEITHVPTAICDRVRHIGATTPVLTQYERICFKKDKINHTPIAAFICPGHPLLDTTIDLILERHGNLLERGAVLIDETDRSDQLRVLFCMEHAIQDGRTPHNQEAQIISQRLQFVEYLEDQSLSDAGPAPYLDYRPANAEERELLLEAVSTNWLNGDIESQAMGFAIDHIVQKHAIEVRSRRLPEIDKVTQEVVTRLKGEINYWTNQAGNLQEKERAGKKSRLSSSKAQARTQDLEMRLKRRLSELENQRKISAQTPVIQGGAIVVPMQTLMQLRGEKQEGRKQEGKSQGKEKQDGRKQGKEKQAKAQGPKIPNRAELKTLGMQAVMQAERNLGHTPKDTSIEQGTGYDIVSKDNKNNPQLFIDVKTKWHTDDKVYISKNEILCSRNEPKNFRLAIVIVSPEGTKPPRYLTNFDFGDPVFAETSKIFSLKKLLERSEKPA